MATNKGNTKTFQLILYLDNPDHMEIINTLEQSDLEYTYIIHDKDVSMRTGELLKPHIHVLIRYSGQRSTKAVADDFGLPENMIEKVHDYIGSLLYLVHAKNTDKYQYPESDVKGSAMGLSAFKNAISLYRNKEISEDEKIMEIVNLISNWKGKIRYRELIIECCNRGRYAELRRGAYLIKELVYEHNEALEAHKTYN